MHLVITMIRICLFQVAITVLFKMTSLKMTSGYDITNMTFVDCPVRKRGHSAETGLSFNGCVDQCARKPWCAELIYDRRQQLCYMCGNRFCPTEYNNKTGKGCVRVLKDEFRDDEVTNCENACGPMNTYSTCDRLNGGCMFAECPRIVLMDGQLEGNMNRNGSRKKIVCKQGFIELMGREHVECIDGDWAFMPFCDTSITLG